ncbi:MAG: Crp/Fnr family transcriptional regulator [bacterium]
MNNTNFKSKSNNLDEANNRFFSVVEKAVFLRGIGLFSRTKTEDLARIAAITEEIEFKKRDTIFGEKDHGASLFFVVSGEVSLRKGDKEIRRVFSQGHFGDLALLDNEPREFTAVAVQATRVLKIDSEEFYELMEDHIEITRAVFTSLTSQIRRLVQQ